MPGPLIPNASAWMLALLLGGLAAGVEAAAGGSPAVGLVLPLACAALALYLHKAPGQREKLEKLPWGQGMLLAVVLLVVAGLVARWGLGEATVAALLSAAALGAVVVPVVLTTRSCGVDEGRRGRDGRGSGSR